MEKEFEVPILNAFDIRNTFFEDSEQKKSLQPPSNFFYISRIENFKDSIKLPLLPHRKTVYDFEFLTEGSTIRSKGLDNFSFNANTFFFLPAYQISTHDKMAPETKGFYCHFEADLLQKNLIHSNITNEFSFLQLTENPIVQLPKDKLSDIVYLLNRMEKEYLSQNVDKYDLIQVLLLALFVELKRYAVPSPLSAQNAALRITQLYKNALSQSIYEKHLVVDYADLLSISPNHLNKSVKKITGKSAHDLLDEMILLEAKVLLKQTNLTISEIAFKIGKHDPSDFGRFFKSKMGQTPSEYRVLTKPSF